MINSIILGLNFISEHNVMIEELKQRAINEYKAALLLPRKKKKRAKKSAQLLYSIACHGENIINF